VLEGGGVGHVPDHVAREQLEFERRTFREALGQGGKQLVDLLLAVRVAPRSQDTDGLLARPQCPARGRFTVVQCALCDVQRGIDPVEKPSRSVMRSS
jgi:hypothetical protein